MDPRYRGPMSRLLIAYMILGGPMVRIVERYLWRNRILRGRDRSGLPKSPARLTVAPFRRSVNAAFWSDHGVERDEVLRDIIHLLKERKYFINIQDGWKEWDFKVQQGLWSYALVQSCTENHGGSQRLMRLKASLRFSGLSKALGAAWVMLLLVLVATGHQRQALILLVAGMGVTLGITCQVVKLTLALMRVFGHSAARLGMLPIGSRAPSTDRPPFPSDLSIAANGIAANGMLSPAK